MGAGLRRGGAAVVPAGYHARDPSRRWSRRRRHGRNRRRPASWRRRDRRLFPPSTARQAPRVRCAASASAGIARGSGGAVQITVAQTAASGASIASTALSCIAAKTSVASRHPDAGEIVGERACAVRVVRRIEQELGAAEGEPLESAGPSHVAEGGPDGGVRQPGTPAGRSRRGRTPPPWRCAADAAPRGRAASCAASAALSPQSEARINVAPRSRQTSSTTR